MKLSEIKIDPEFKALLRPQTQFEHEYLKQSLMHEQLREPLTVWNDTIIDGHNRYAILKSFDVPDSSIPVIEMSFDSREHVIAWIKKNQISRRNLSPEECAKIQGIKYNRMKSKQGGDRKSKVQDDTLNIAEKLAKEFDVSASTIKRNGKMAERVDELIAAGFTEDQAIHVWKDEKKAKAGITNMISIPAKEYESLKKSFRNEPVPDAAGLIQGTFFEEPTKIDDTEEPVYTPPDTDPEDKLIEVVSKATGIKYKPILLSELKRLKLAAEELITVRADIVYLEGENDRLKQDNDRLNGIIAGHEAKEQARRDKQNSQPARMAKSKKAVK